MKCARFKQFPLSLMDKIIRDMHLMTVYDGKCRFSNSDCKVMR